MGGPRGRCGDTGQTGDSQPRMDGGGFPRFHHAAQNSPKFKVYESFISEFSHLISLIIVDFGN